MLKIVRNAYLYTFIKVITESRNIVAMDWHGDSYHESYPLVQQNISLT